MSDSEIRINHPAGDVPAGALTWTTEELVSEFEVLSFAAPYVVVRRLADGQRGSLEFTGGGGQPRLYFDFKEAT